MTGFPYRKGRVVGGPYAAEGLKRTGYTPVVVMMVHRNGHIVHSLNTPEVQKFQEAEIEDFISTLRAALLERVRRKRQRG